MVSSSTGRYIAAPFLIAGLAACSGTPTSPNGALAPSASSLAAVNGTAEFAEFEVCKQYSGAAGPAVTVNYTVDLDANGSNEVSSSVQLANGQCAVVHTYQQAGSNNGTQIQRVTVTEQVPAGYTATVRKTTILSTGTTVGPTQAGNSASGDMISNPDNGFLVLFTNTAAPPPPPPAPGTGRFTGGGSTVVGNVRISNGLTIHCDRLLSNNLEVNWDGNRFHMEEHLTTVACTDDPAIDQRPPAAPIDTLIGTGTGRYNGVDGYTIEFTLVDGGEPGSRDRIALKIYPTGNPGAAVLTLPLQTVTTGNLQAHFDQPHK
jgi:hypothetical protein